MTTKLTEHKGTGVRVLGSFVDNWTLPLPCSYSIDGRPGISPNNTMTYETSDGRYQNLFFQSQGLTAGFHSLLITTLESDRGGTVYLDLFEVTPDPGGPLPIATTSNPTTGQIIGGVIGVIALLTFSAAFIAFLFFRWKKNHSKAHGADEVGHEALL